MTMHWTICNECSAVLCYFIRVLARDAHVVVTYMRRLIQVRVMPQYSECAVVIIYLPFEFTNVFSVERKKYHSWKSCVSTKELPSSIYRLASLREKVGESESITHTHIHTYTHTYTHTHTYPHIHARTHARTHTIMRIGVNDQIKSNQVYLVTHMSDTFHYNLCNLGAYN